VAQQDKLAHKPANLSFAQAAAVPVSAGTALQALVDAGRVQAGQSVRRVGSPDGSGRSSATSGETPSMGPGSPAAREV